MPQSTENAVHVVQEFWRLMTTNDFHSATAVLADDFVLEWPQSKERIRGAFNFAQFNAEYPAQGRWVFTINRIVGNETDAVSDVSITDSVLQARAISFFTVEHGKIARVVEYWPENYEPPFDRTKWVERIE
ncbi:nuclear transport factor 2 family protein [Paraburkholderia sp. BCC1876]|uniref:nuclear transport factor 2 family protein n=1 Tax=Paraburkholderia sp. BCC1876 TaxID=2676303 RepID=UPI0015905C97|nr:nuclear transport factor 2 family protein [Paraburkholderia sp. BCC1876]